LVGDTEFIVQGIEELGVDGDFHVSLCSWGWVVTGGWAVSALMPFVPAILADGRGAGGFYHLDDSFPDESGVGFSGEGDDDRTGGQPVGRLGEIGRAVLVD
jgi:hypothetical protein